jgi:2-polyprenyl-3-methyl-5-hydroxy-6-metoxy-1,4-benzoquinol methylase
VIATPRAPRFKPPMKVDDNIHIRYDQVAKPYHLVVARLMCRYAPPNASVLDIGCGVGHCLVEIRRLRPDIRLVAADIDKNCLDLTDSRVGLDGRLLISAVEDLFGRGGDYDGVIMSHSLEHMQAPVTVAREVAKLIRQGGVLILAVPNPVRLTVMISNLRRRRNVNRGHVMAWDRSHWMNFIENILGFDVIEYAEDYFQLPFKWGERIPGARAVELKLVRWFPWFSMSNIVALRM